VKEKVSFPRPYHNRGRKPLVEGVAVSGRTVPRHTNEFWTHRQRQSCSIHEISYRACFKAQLPRFFIEALTKPGDAVYDPFGGRGTTAVESALLRRRVVSNDVNPLSEILARPRLSPPRLSELTERLAEIPIDKSLRAGMDLSMFYEGQTEAEIVSLKAYLQERHESGKEDSLDSWLRMVATNRLTGHSTGYFSVYTLPPNQATSPERQRKINRKLGQRPEYRDTRKIILKKSKSLLRALTDGQRRALVKASGSARFLTKDARDTSEIPGGSVALTVTSPPFLDVVQYSADNWLRCWFNGIDADKVARGITMSHTLDEWSKVMGETFAELYRVTKKGGHVAFEVGEIRKASVKLDEYVVPLGLRAGFECVCIVVNAQEFTKTANIWGVSNMRRGTNTNRIVVFKKI